MTDEFTHGLASAGWLRRELCERAQQYARTHNLPHSLSYGESPAVCFECYDNDSQHGNFFPATYKAIVKNPNWRRRMRKVHSKGRKSFPCHEDARVRRELDTCTSSDALLMSVFCHRGVVRREKVCSLVGVKPGSIPEFGFRARVPLISGKVDRTEVDMRLDQLLVEAKLTESDFQRVPKKAMDSYRDFHEVFDSHELPQSEQHYFSYQLLRNVLAAYVSNCRFCLLTDARRPHLIEAWYAIMKCVRLAELRSSCQILAWQELAKALPTRLRTFLRVKYGIE